MTVQDMEVEHIYEELEGEEVYAEVEGVRDDGWTGYVEDMTRESEDEGVWVDGDAGFPWEDTRLELWRWEEENGMGEDEREDEDVSEDSPGLLPAEEEEEEEWI